MATLVTCEYPNSSGGIAIGLEDLSGDVEGFEIPRSRNTLRFPELGDMTIGNIQDHLPRIALFLAQQYSQLAKENKALSGENSALEEESYYWPDS